MRKAVHLDRSQLLSEVSIGLENDLERECELLVSYNLPLKTSSEHRDSWTPAN